MHFSVKNDAARFAQRFGNRFLPSRLYAITPTGRFDSCLYFEIQKFLKNYHGIDKIDVEHDFVRTILPGKFNNAYNSIADLSALNLPLRDYQQETVRKCIDCGRGVVVAVDCRVHRIAFGRKNCESHSRSGHSVATYSGRGNENPCENPQNRGRD